MFLRARPLVAMMRGRLRGHSDLAETAEEVIVECPAGSGWMPGVLMLDEDRAKVVATPEMTTLAEQWRRVEGYVSEHAATVRYVFRDVLATPNGFYAGWAAHSRGLRLDPWAILRAPIERRAAGFYALSPVSMIYFGHWLSDSLCTARLRRDGEDLFLPADPRWTHARAYADALGIDRLGADHVHFDRMSFCVDYGQNANRRARVRALHADISGLAGKGPSDKVYVRRGRSVARKAALVNEAALIDRLTRRGFGIADTDRPLAEIWATLGGARTVVTLEGSHWVHAFQAAAPDADHLLINPADRFNNVAAEMVPALGGRTATSIAVSVDGGYEVDIDGVLTLLDRLAATRSDPRPDGSGPRPA